MFSVRHSNAFRMAASGAALILLTAGCSSSSFLARFAPPGVVKYEDIASEKPPNPAIEATVRDYREDTRARFPVLSRTPTAGPPPQIPDGARRDALKAELIDGREKLADEVSGDQAAIDAEQAQGEAITSRGERFNDQLERDSAAAKAERRDELTNDLPQEP